MVLLSRNINTRDTDTTRNWYNSTSTGTIPSYSFRMKKNHTSHRSQVRWMILRISRNTPGSTFTSRRTTWNTPRPQYVSNYSECYRYWYNFTIRRTIWYSTQEELPDPEIQEIQDTTGIHIHQLSTGIIPYLLKVLHYISFWEVLLRTIMPFKFVLQLHLHRNYTFTLILDTTGIDITPPPQELYLQQFNEIQYSRTR